MTAAAANPARAWLALAALLAAGSVPAWWIPAAAIDWQPGLAGDQPWRAWTAAWVHWSALHLIANLAAVAVLAWFGAVARLPWPAALAWALAWPSTQWALLTVPELAHYGGLSGVLHAGVAIGALWLVASGVGRQRAIGTAVGLGLAAKVLLEQPWGPALRSGGGWDIATAPAAHAAGAVAGLACGALAWWATRPRSAGATGLEAAAEASHTTPATRPITSTPVRPAAMARAPATTDGQRKAALDALAVMLLVGCAGVWGLGQAAAKVGLQEVPPLFQAALRSGGAALLLLAWSWRRGVPVTRRDGTGVAGLTAGLLFAAEFGCIFVGLQHTHASRMSVFLYLAPFFVAVAMPLVAPSERLRLPQAAGLLLAFTGVVWAYADGLARPAAGPLQWRGDALGIAAAALWAATTLTVRATRLATAAPEKTLLYQLAVSAAALGMASWWQGESWSLDWSATTVGVMVFQTVVITFASYLVWFWLVRHYPATQVSAFTLLTPVFGLFAGVWLLAEPLAPRLLAALVAVCAGIALVNRRAR